MKKIKQLIIVLIAMIMTIPFGMTEMKAADSYEDASTFFNSANDDKYRCEFIDDYFYYATKGKIGSADNRRYGSIGWRIIATGNGQSMYVDVARSWNNGTSSYKSEYLEEIQEEQETEGSTKYSYNLYRISYSNIAKRMNGKNATLWTEICKGNSVQFQFTAILSVKPGGSTDTTSHIIKELPNGEVTFDNKTHVYYVGTEEGLAGIQALFTSTDFSPFYEIQGRLYNPTLSIQYNVNGGTVKDTINDGVTYTQSGDVLKKNNLTTIQEVSRHSVFLALDPNQIGLSKPGYQFSYWKNSCDKALNSHKTLGIDTYHYGGDLCPHLASSLEDQTITLTANWTPITYKLVYHANDGSGNTTTKSCTYGNTYSVLSNMYTYANHTFKGWNTKSDGSGDDWYTEGQSVSDLRSVDGETFDLYAIWNPNVYEITIDANGGSGGTGKFYEIFGSIHIFFCRRPNSNYFLEEKYP